MAGSRRRRQQQRQKLRALEAARRPPPDDVVGAVAERLPPDVLLRRLAFASVCGASGHTFKQEAPWLLAPGETEETATVLSVAEGAAAATVRTSDPAMRGHVVLGSGGGWLVTADERATLRMANPATGAHAEMPAIATIPFLTPRGYNECRWFTLDGEGFLRARFGGGPPPPEGSDWALRPPRSFTLTAAQMRGSFYRKVVLSASPRPGSCAAMLITDRHIGAPAFAAAGDPVWRMAPSRDGVEDAIHHGGRFLSITYAGDVEAWGRDAGTGQITSAVVAPRLGFVPANLSRKYLAVAPGDGRLMAVLKYSKDIERESCRIWPRKVSRVVFEVLVLDEEHGRWDAMRDIGDAAVFVGVNGSLCVSTWEHPGVRAGCVYSADDEVGEACVLHEQGSYNNRDSSSSYDERMVDDDELRSVGVYSMKDGKVVDTIYGTGQQQGRWPPPAWFTPSFL